MTSMATAALELARTGLRVFPVDQREKRPLVRGWQREATDDGNAVLVLWDRFPQANIGIACGAELVVVDADSERGIAALRDLGLPDTVSAWTPRGRHWYFRGSSKNRVAVLPDVDVRGRGGFVVAPPSRYLEARYEWLLAPSEIELAPVPEALIEVVDAKPSTRPAQPREIPIGRRNSELFRRGCSLRGISGLSGEEIADTLATVNKHRCRPPLSSSEVRCIAQSASSYDLAPEWATNSIAYANDPALGAGDRFLLIVLAHHANHEGQCWPSIRRLSELTGFAKDTVTKHIRALEDAGRIRVEQRGRPHCYQLLDNPGTTM